MLYSQENHHVRLQSSGQRLEAPTIAHAFRQTGVTACGDTLHSYPPPPKYGLESLSMSCMIVAPSTVPVHIMMVYGNGSSPVVNPPRHEAVGHVYGQCHPQLLQHHLAAATHAVPVAPVEYSQGRTKPEQSSCKKHGGRWSSDGGGRVRPGVAGGVCTNQWVQAAVMSLSYHLKILTSW